MTTMHPPGIYTTAATGRFYTPFNLHIDPMERLILINFEKDPDEIYLGFEVQYFDDAVNGKGLLVLAARHDQRVDVYHQPGMHLSHKNFAIVGKGLADQLERTMAGARFVITAAGVDLHLQFEDKLGRPVELRVKEGGAGPRQPFALFAPLGSAAEHPPSMPLLFLYRFDFVRRRGTDLVINVNGQTRRPDTLPVPLDRQRVYFARYTADPFITTFNVAHDGPLAPLLPPGAGELRDGDVVYDLVENAGHFEIRRLTGQRGPHQVAIVFTPAVPDVLALAENCAVEGRFIIRTEQPAVGHLGGMYRVNRREGQTYLRLHPDKGWKPRERKWSVNFVYLVVRSFKQWPKTYVWDAIITPAGDGVTMRSGWVRTRPPQGLNPARGTGA